MTLDRATQRLINARMKRAAALNPSKPRPTQTQLCPECNGAGGWPSNEELPVKRSFDDEYGETYLSNWLECSECHGSGEIEQEIEEDE